jgi:hypothetical protein
LFFLSTEQQKSTVETLIERLEVENDNDTKVCSIKKQKITTDAYVFMKGHDYFTCRKMLSVS